MADAPNPLAAALIEDMLRVFLPAFRPFAAAVAEYGGRRHYDLPGREAARLALHARAREVAVVVEDWRGLVDLPGLIADGARETGTAGRLAAACVAEAVAFARTGDPVGLEDVSARTFAHKAETRPAGPAAQ